MADLAFVKGHGNMPGFLENETRDYSNPAVKGSLYLKGVDLHETATESLEDDSAVSSSPFHQTAFTQEATIIYSLASVSTAGIASATHWLAVASNFKIAPEKVIMAKAMKKPKAHAGKNQDLKDDDNDGKEIVKLDGSDSEDKDGHITSYSWSIEGTSSVLTTGVKPTVELGVGTTTIVLTVTDNEGLTDTAKVKIRIREGKDDDDDDDDDEDEPDNKAPVAHAGDNQQLTDTDNDGVETVRLDGSGSKDEDGSIAIYSWRVSGEEIATGVNPTVELGVGTTTIVLTVTDDEGLTDTDEVEIIINEPANEAPVADAGADQTLLDTDENGVETVRLDGSGSKDEDGSIATYSWRVSGEEIATGVNPTVELPVGSSTIVLMVTDDEGLTDTDEVEVTINEPANEAPQAVAGENQVFTVDEGVSELEVQLDGSGSTDPDGAIAGYSWRIAGTEIATGVNPTVVLPLGISVIVLTVTDDGGLTATDEVEIRIEVGEDEEPENIAPVARAGDDQQLTDTDEDGVEVVNLDGSASADEDGTIVSYSWSIAGEEIASGVNATASLPVGSSTLVLTVTDDGGLTATDEVEIIVNEGEGKEEGESGTAFLPNLFSPNGDQMNDAFVLHATNLERIHWRIYNRQNRLVYETQDIEAATQLGWDGNAFDGPQPEGSYIWILEGSYTDGTPVLINGEIKGSVTLIR